MKTILVGYPGSQRIRKASEYLLRKYTSLEPTYLNYEGPILGWSKYLADYLETLDDEYVVLGLDDYLISHPMMVFEPVLEPDVVCAKLCECTDAENEEYPVTTQYTLWNRLYLITLLWQTTTPWDFEMNGSKIFKATNQKMQHWPVLKYYTNSCLSNRWYGIRLDGLNEEDINEVRKLI